MSERPSNLLEVRNTLHHVLRQVDSNGDGYIDKDELYFVLDRVGTFKKAKWSNLQETLDKLLAGLDTNSDGFVDIQEFIDWVLLDKTACTSHCLQIQHVFLSAEDEARMERIALFELEAKENNDILVRAGLGELMDPNRLLLSVGSSSTQAYDSKGLTLSVPTGTKEQAFHTSRSFSSTLSATYYSHLILFLWIWTSWQDERRIVQLIALTALFGRHSLKRRYACTTEQRTLVQNATSFPSSSMTLACR